MLKLFVSLQNTLAGLRDREDGQAFAEYGVLLAVVAIGLIVALGLFRQDIADWFDALAGKLNGAK
jgi:Flp pilus assembly pilin Flp